MRLTTSLVLGMALLLGGRALAQQSPAPSAPPARPPAGGTPDRVPFDTPYGSPITIDRAQRVVAAALDELKKHPAWQYAIAVVDPAGELVYFYRQDGVQLASIGIAQDKARTSARFRRETRTFYDAYETGHSYVHTLDPALVASPGGFPLVENGKIVGAIGCSGGTGDQDAAVCKAGADSLK
jgi:glc operon protein GlcG